MSAERRVDTLRSLTPRQRHDAVTRAQALANSATELAAELAALEVDAIAAARALGVEVPADNQHQES